MENLIEQLVDMVNGTIEEGGKLNIIHITSTASYSNIFVPYEFYMNSGCLCIEGDYSELNLNNIGNMSVSYDIILDEYKLTSGKESILICRI